MEVIQQISKDKPLLTRNKTQKIVWLFDVALPYIIAPITPKHVQLWSLHLSPTAAMPVNSTNTGEKKLILLMA